jgi:hypothetical protein
VADRVCCTARCTGSPETAQADAELPELVAAWPTLPELIRTAIVALANAPR